MQLYHYTTADKVLAIKELGLLPAPELTNAPAAAVVWLTKQPDVSMPEEAAYIMATLGFYESPLSDLDDLKTGKKNTSAAGPCRQWWYGSKGKRLDMDVDGRKINVTYVPQDDDLVRLTVQVPKNNSLNRYVTWPLRPLSGIHRVFYRMPHVRLWYVYTDRIEPSWITEITKAQDYSGARMAEVA
jgi:hypothetical protein